MKLAHVERPVVIEEVPGRLGSKDAGACARPADASQDRGDEEPDVFTQIAERRQVDAQTRVPAEQVASKRFALDELAEGLVRRCDDSHVDLGRASRRPGRPRLPAEREAESPGRGGASRRFRRGKASPGRRADEAQFGLNGTGERPFGVTKSCDSTSDWGSAPQLTATNSPDRPDRVCTARASTSLPVPVAPRRRIATLDFDTTAIRARAAAKAGRSVAMPGTASADERESKTGAVPSGV